MIEAAAAPPIIDWSLTALRAEAARSAVAWRDRTGGGVVGYMGIDVPVEIIEAAGLYPFRIGLPVEGRLEAAARFFEIGDSETVAQMIEPLLDGSLSFVDHLVIGNTPTTNVAVFHFLREARRRDPALMAPPISLHETQHADDVVAAAYNLKSCQHLAARMEELGGPITEESLAAAISRGDARRAAASGLAHRRRGDALRLSGTRALRALVAAQMLPQFEIDAQDDQPTVAPRVMFSGSDIGHLHHYAAVEGAGCVIIADDHDWGEQVFEGMIGPGGATLGSVALRYSRLAPRSARWPTQVRIDAVVERARLSGAQGVVFWISEEDQASSWDFPILTQALHQQGIETFDIGPQPPGGALTPATHDRPVQWLDRMANVRSLEDAQ